MQKFILNTIIFLFLLIATNEAYPYPMTPDISMTTGALCSVIDNDFDEYRYEEKIPYCFRNVSSRLKKYIYEQYEIPLEERNQYTIDHLIPLSIGGSNNIKNLWPEHKAVKAMRSNLEEHLYFKVKEGKMLQKEAIEILIKCKFHPEKSECNQI